ncbi:MAG: dTDP-4-dehydrorhamnose 3,5-epimerase [Deltaproteobacteria bacterium]|nr:dTDP-4-dehydrorhamnose 3,5-epimerase [Deltaproteobacteria bacterium]
MKIIKSKIKDLVIIEPRVFPDGRGCFFESYQKQRYQDAGIKEAFVQDNVSCSTKGVLRGLHAQNPSAQGKLVSVLQGEVFDVAVDVRQGSATFGQWEGVTLNHENKMQFYVPPGFLHGFCVLSETAIFSYKCTDYYNKEAEFGVIWNDPDIGIQWPSENVLLSDKDSQLPQLKELDDSVFRLEAHE